MNVKFSLTSVLGIPKTDEMAAIFLLLIKVFKLKKEYKIKMLIGVHKLKCLSTNFYPFCIVRQIRKSPLINQILQSDGNNCRLHDCG